MGAGSLVALGASAGSPGQAAADLTGDWVLNAALSQPSPLPGARPGVGGGMPGGALPVDGPIPPEDSVLPDPPIQVGEDAPRPVRRRAPSWAFRPERLEALRVVLGESRLLSIVQGPRYVDLRTEATARSLEPGVESQVSLPTGELADQKVRWQGRRLLVERRVPRGAKVVESYERLAATDQLLVTVRRSGSAEDGLGRIEWRRIFDRDQDGTLAAGSGSAAAGGTPPRSGGSAR